MPCVGPSLDLPLRTGVDVAHTVAMGSLLKCVAVVLAGLALGAVGRLMRDDGRQWRGLSGAVERGSAELSVDGAAGTASSPADSGAWARGAPPAESESVDSILDASGFEQAERLGRFLVAAKPADLERLLLGLRDQGGQEDTILQDAIFLKWMTVDASGGLAFAEKEGFTSMVWWAWGKTHPEEALAAALARPDTGVGTMVVRAIAQSDPFRAQQILDLHPQFQESTAMEGLASGMMKVDPVAGATLAAAWNYTINSDNLISGWTRREPEAALAWASGLPELSKREEALRLVLDQWGATHPEKVEPAIKALPEGRMKWKFYAEHANRLATTNPEVAHAWVEAAPTPLLRREAAAEHARGLISSDPAAALEVLRGQDWSDAHLSLANRRILRPGGQDIFGGNALTDVVTEISGVAPAETLSFVGSLPAASPLKAHLTREAFQSWVSHDSMSASQWLANQPAGPARHSAAEQLALHLSRGPSPDFEAAAQWALTLPRNPGISTVVSQVFQEWRGRDREAAQAFIDQPECPPEVRAAVAADAPTQ